MLIARLAFFAVSIVLVASAAVKPKTCSVKDIVFTLVSQVRKTTIEIIDLRGKPETRTAEHLLGPIKELSNHLKNATTALNRNPSIKVVDEELIGHEANLIIEIVTTVADLKDKIPELDEAITTLDSDLADEMTQFQLKIGDRDSECTPDLLANLLAAVRQNIMVPRRFRTSACRLKLKANDTMNCTPEEIAILATQPCNANPKA